MATKYYLDQPGLERLVDYINNSLDNKANIGDVPANVVVKADLADYALKSDIPEGQDLSGYATTNDLATLEGKVTGVYHFRGSVPNLEALQAVENPAEKLQTAFLDSNFLLSKRLPCQGTALDLASAHSFLNIRYAIGHMPNHMQKRRICTVFLPCGRIYGLLAYLRPCPRVTGNIGHTSRHISVTPKGETGAPSPSKSCGEVGAVIQAQRISSGFGRGKRSRSSRGEICSAETASETPLYSASK